MTSVDTPPHDTPAPDTIERLAIEHPRQPLLNDAVIALRAPTQAWSGHDGDLGTAAIDGIYHGDVRHVRTLVLECANSPVEWISTVVEGPSRVVFTGLLRGLDDASPDPRVRIVRDRSVSAGRVHETWTVRSRVEHRISTRVTLRLEPDFALLHEIKSGAAAPRHIDVTIPDAAATATATATASATATAGPRSFVLDAPGGSLGSDGDALVVSWPLELTPGGTAEVAWSLTLRDATLVVRAPSAPARWDAAAVAASSTDPRLARWLRTALGDLDALRLALPAAPEDDFYAAGAPWFFTLFGRDSLWAARLALPLDVGIASSTLRVLASLQGTIHDPATAQEPGKILHELRASAIELPSEGIVLPPRYYGSVDATPLWVCLLADAWHAGMPDEEVRALVPALRAALGWLLTDGDSDGDGFLDYIDRLGTGLANQGWKDSGDSIQWRDGRLAEGPIALCEVQGYAYEAALAGAALLEAFGDPEDDPDALRAWAANLKARFAEAYWVTTPEGRYPAIALDRDKNPVDTLTSNIGHLLGTGILEPEDEAHIAALLRGPSMSSGYGIRTMSTGAAGYWPLSYHGGSVWVHDTAIAVHGMLRAGLVADARAVVRELIDASEGFGYRVPELHAGDPASDTSAPTPYPAACRPQAWSAAAVVTCLTALAG